ncbi:MAG: polysaccharide deacetylase family protein, partial [Microcystaceae cyanobacterium]
MPPLRQASKQSSFPYKYLAICISLFLITACLTPFAISHTAKTAIYSSANPQHCESSLISTPGLTLGLTQTHSASNCQNVSTSPQQNLVLSKPESNQSIKDVEAALDKGDDSIVSVILQSRPWPQIHEYARLAKVPVMMYHDILPNKQVFFDVTPQELEADFELIKSNGLTPVTLKQLVLHLQTGIPLPEKPILLTFDDGYQGHYQYVYPLLKQYGYPAVFSIYYNKVGRQIGRSGVTWEQLQEMAIDPLITIACHSMTHPDDLSILPDDQLTQEIIDSKRLLEEKLGITIRYFTYPSGKFDDRVREVVTTASYDAALAMNDLDEHFAGESKDLLEIGRFGQSRLEEIVEQVWGGFP